MACGGVICLKCTSFATKILKLYDIRMLLYISLLEVYPGPESNRHACLGRGILSP